MTFTSQSFTPRWNTEGKKGEVSIGEENISLKVKLVFWLLIKWRFLTETQAIMEHFSPEARRSEPRLPEG